ncbi:fibronectin type III domain-containing protein [Paenibacillus amylolyticus]|uniref:fibronectin type III domain-containing protein n=1 Tax=Paenibacillus amylolyticus TaxID=1451 RepID=UPI000B86C50A|nr:fibronectin type III domain-containing protein [Paenibacillus amylolyticus]
MKVTFLKKISFLFAVLFFITGIVLNPNVNAASIGESLTSPDEGWKRYDDMDPFIKYEGIGWSHVTDDVNTYAGSGHFNKLSGATSNAIKFKFYGTKLRIIDVYWNNRVNNVTIEIDGKISTYNPNNSVNLYQALVFESLNLPLGIHEVKLTTTSTSNTFSLDAIDIDDSGRLVGENEPLYLKAVPGDSQVALSWMQVEGADKYTIRYGTDPGKFTETVTATKDVYGNFIVPGLINGTKYYFVVNSIVNGVESEYSNEASATPQAKVVEPEEPAGNRAILVVTMTTGLEKEFDLSMKEVNAFIDWYELKQSGSGKASYAINKHDNNKGPFKSRKDYILFDRVLTFEVSEY